MDRITKLIKSEIKKQYKNVRQFSEKSGIPYSTLSNALSKGIGGTSYETVIKICKLLNLKQASDGEFTVYTDQFYEMCSKLSELDDKALHTVNTVLNVEYDRCRGTSLRVIKGGSPQKGLRICADIKEFKAIED